MPDIVIHQSSGNFYQDVALYGLISLLILMFIICIIYILCARKLRLNWYEKTTLENLDRSTVLVHVLPDTPKGSQSLSSSTTNVACWPIEPNGDEQYAKEITAPGSPTSESNFGGGEVDGCRTVVTSNGKQMIIANVSPAWPKVTSMHSKLDHTKIDASLYVDQETSSKSLSEDMRGSIHFTALHDTAGLLTVRLIEANDIQPREFSGTADPYAKIRLLPDVTNVWQTRIHKKTLNPVFDEDFVFEVDNNTLTKRILEIVLCDFDAYSRHHYIGSVKLPLEQVDLTQLVDVWKPLERCTANDNIDIGELMISLSYLPSAGRLTVVIVKARNLKIVDETRSTSDPFVKVTLMVGQKRTKKKKTGIQRNNLNPVFNEAVTFDVTRENMRKTALEFCIFHDNLLGTKELMGRVVIGNSPLSTSENKTFYNGIMRNKSASAKWLQLKDGLFVLK